LPQDVTLCSALWLFSQCKWLCTCRAISKTLG